MAGALKASELVYGTPVRISIGSWFLTATTIETPTGKEPVGTEGTGGELELKLTKLGLPDEIIAGSTASVGFQGLGGGGEPPIGELAAGTAPPAMIWCTNLVEAKTANETGKNCKKVFPCEVTVVKGKPILRIFNLPAAKKEMAEITEAEKAEATTSLCRVTVFVVGK